jgi:hypothetical protein
VAVAVRLAVGVAVVVGVGVAPSVLVRSTACAEREMLAPPLAVALKVTEGLPWKGAARSANARVKPSCVEIVLKRCFSELDSATVGPEPAWPP